MDNNSIAIGDHAITTNVSSVAIGRSCRAYGPRNSIVLGPGASAGENAIAIGSNVEAGDDEIIIVNLKKLRDQVQELQSIVEKQNELILQMYYAPNGPGAHEAKERFEKDIRKLK